MGFKREVKIDKPMDLVYRVLTTYEYAPKVLDHIEKVDIQGDSIQVGTKIVETRKIGQQTIDNTLEVVEYEPNHRFATYSVQNGLDLHYIYALSEQNGTTTIQFEGKIKTKGIRNFLSKPIISWLIKREDGQHLEKLNQYIFNNYKDE
ncbi:SRPBCC family protein [Aquisalibacillus elongatus]|uniref:Polyketide cyclase/dehydrase/lipid transport protein n=1 Tax=Aquisalibacillus elongatus TaxID=485577 RepID=A0A3N5B9C8_9BACI|nr:SRPBCC family protein [Aquisalibacillus elongatus]RPF53967.1 polyketide cyclase/dehydrase/lipid transport protein [Aquisalibacillus elongatus]